MRSLVNTSSLALPIALVAVTLQSVTSNQNVIADERIRSLAVTPALGRGYSIMTNNFYSTCLMVDEVTEPQYDYDCE